MFGNIGGTVLRLSGQSKVLFSGQEMSFEPVTGRYQYISNGFLEEGTFEWTDNNGKKFTNSVSITETIESPDVTTLSRANDYTYQWVGAPLKANQSVTVFIFEPSGQNSTTIFQASPGATVVIVERNAITKITTPTAVLVADRAMQVNAAEAPAAGGLLIGKYRAKSRTINLN